MRDVDEKKPCRNAGINELQNLKYLPRASVEREIVFEDRTPAHADHVGFGHERQTTAAVGESSASSAFATCLGTLVDELDQGAKGPKQLAESWF